MAYTTIDDPSAHFQTITFTGTGSEQSITNTGNSDLQPDFAWIKLRAGSAVKGHGLSDSNRGSTKMLFSQDNSAEADVTEGFKSFNSDGFTVGTDTTANLTDGTIVCWQWKANGGSTTSGGGDDSIGTSAYQANDTAGFSIITYTGNDTDDATVKHGLSAEPDIIISKSRTSAHHWWVHGNAIPTGDTNYLLLQATGAVDAAADVIKSIGSSTVTIGDNTNINTNASLYVQYAFRSIQGYSKFGSYEGNGNADGTFIYLGFKPRWIITKGIDNSGRTWVIRDTARDGTNPNTFDIYPDSNSGAEYTSGMGIDFLSNGFKMRGTSSTFNGSETYIYMAFAEQPFVTSSGVPATAR